MTRGDIHSKYVENITAVKWYGKQGVPFIGTCLEGCNKVSYVSQRMKGQSIKLAIACLQMIKGHHSGIGGVNLMDQKTPS